ncbi:uncharacterized protein VTP21DRAFT_1682 [Calcarisporiella thermophila]|uniref:uncharacterized protein n=1 Tax=Calcarisporiella thermophila TaxID=911321 RepID=UPI0037444553
MASAPSQPQLHPSSNPLPQPSPDPQAVSDRNGLIPQTDSNENSEDETFDWEARIETEIDDPDYRKKKRQTARGFARLSPFMRSLVGGTIGASILVAPGIVAHFVMLDPSQEFTKRSIELWSFWAAWIWGITWITYFWVQVLPKIVVTVTKRFWGQCPEWLKLRLEYFIGVRTWIIVAIVVAWMWGSFAFLTNIIFVEMSQLSDYIRIYDIFRALFGSSIILLAEKFLVQLIAIRFHQSAYKDRIKENKYALRVLDKLMKSNNKFRTDGLLRKRRPKASRFNTADGTSTGNSTRRNSSENTGEYRDDIALQIYRADTENPNADRSQTNVGYSTGRNQESPFFITKNPPVFLSAINKKLTNIAMAENKDLAQTREIHSSRQAAKIARKLFTGLQGNRSYLVAEDFLPYFNHDEDEAKRAFAIFDRDGNGDISRSEMLDIVHFIYKERRYLANSLRDVSQAVGKLDIIFMVIAFLIILFIFLAIFNTDIWSSLVPYTSAFVALNFLFGGTAKDLFNNIIFLFVTHPFDVGDRVYLGENTAYTHYIVKNIGLMTTVMVRWDGQIIYMPNKVLSTKNIENVRRSGNMAESIFAQVNFNTPRELIMELRDRVRHWLLTEGARDFSPGFDIGFMDMWNVNKINLSFCVEHKSNWQDQGKRFANKTRFALAVKDMLTELGIGYTLPPQPVHVNSVGGHGAPAVQWIPEPERREMRPSTLENQGFQMRYRNRDRFNDERAMDGGDG